MGVGTLDQNNDGYKRKLDRNHILLSNDSHRYLPWHLGHHRLAFVKVFFTNDTGFIAIIKIIGLLPICIV